ncbi:energy transducer TonB family protein [Pseudofulvimonas gallinarii]|uniref:energy transducer TonB family protein n=1 Tax=Pseudofulvimonas gallinarii TaxID=634155 RepID=UPI0035E5F281
MNVLWIVIALAGPPAAATGNEACSQLDPELVHCPAPEAPRITELREGAVTLELYIDPDGSVRSSKVLTSTGHPAWPGAAQAAVAKWRYVAAPDARTREVPFDFLFGDP